MAAPNHRNVAGSDSYGVGSDVQRGVATVVIGGLILATLLTLFILPTFYFVIERRVERWVAARSQLVA